jgi:hypothetical protein
MRAPKKMTTMDSGRYCKFVWIIKWIERMQKPRTQRTKKIAREDECSCSLEEVSTFSIIVGIVGGVGWVVKCVGVELGICLYNFIIIY